MADANRFAAYFSHSWRPRDVDLNLQVWQELAVDCELLVDAPEEPGSDPPYYINRMEELLRRTDLFVSVLTSREPLAGAFTEADAKLHCSPYCLFEIRLAERADLTRLILYERSTGFRPPRTIRPWEIYIPFDRVPSEPRVEQRQWATVIQSKIQQWKDWVTRHSRPMSYEQSTVAALLIGTPTAEQGAPLSRPLPDLDGQEARDVLEGALRNGGYEPRHCDPSRQTSSEAFRLLHEAGLIVAEIGTRDALRDQLYAAAHGLGIPAIRIQSGAGSTELPWILRGNPGGYQEDIVRWNKPEDLATLVEPRIAAMVRLSPALRDGDTTNYLYSKRYSKFFVFISHTLKPPQRMLVDEIYSLLKKRHVTPFEYHQVNTAGMDWKEALKESLKKTTHFVALLSPEYEQSQTCTYELEEILARTEQVSILPFMLAGRITPNPKLAGMHNQLLSDDPRADARVVVDQVMAVLDADLGRSERG